MHSWGREEACFLDVVVLANDEVVSVLGSFRQLNENSVKLWKSLPKGKMGKDGRMRLKTAEVSEALEAILFQETLMVSI
ncbi:unnamed protein product [Prunus armeniaca]